MTEGCTVCGASSAQYHFGAIVCRACAAFFRRYVNTKKIKILCNCLAKKESQFPCRLCRMKKCIEVGMERTKVQGPRDLNTTMKRKMIEGSSSPEAAISQIEYGIKPRSIDHIRVIVKNYNSLETTREIIYNVSELRKVVTVNLYELSLEFKTDTKLMWKLCENTFPEFNDLSGYDKKILFYNFYTKWSIMEIAMFSVKKNDPKNFYSPSGATAKSINEFYVNTARPTNILSENEVISIFEPYWTYHFQNVIAPFLAMKFGEIEFMALFGIMFWDASYANVGKELAELCHAMKTILIRQLSCYLEEIGVSTSRLFEALDALNIIEKAERKCQEEIELCGIYNFDVDEELRNMVLWEKY